VRFFEDSGYFSLIRENGIPIIPTRHHPCLEHVTRQGHLRLSSLCISCLGRDVEALGRRIPAVPFEQVTASKESPRTLQREIFDIASMGARCASMVSQRLKVSYFLNFVSGQSRQLLIVPRALYST
jgi:hypothetical protein